MYYGGYTYTCHSMHPCGNQRTVFWTPLSSSTMWAHSSNLGLQTWQQVPLLVEPSKLLIFRLIFLKKYFVHLPILTKVTIFTIHKIPNTSLKSTYHFTVEKNASDSRKQRMTYSTFLTVTWKLNIYSTITMALEGYPCLFLPHLFIC